MSLNFIWTYYGRSGGGLQVEVAYVKYGELTPGREMTLLKTSLASSSVAVGVPTSPGKVMRLPPMVMRVRLGSLFSGQTLQTT